MSWIKRFGLFFLLNIIIVLTLSALTSLFGFDRFLSAKGLNYSQLALFCLVWGMGGAFISLALSRIMAKWMMGVKLIDENSFDPRLQNLKHTVHELSRQAGLSVMPEVGVYEAAEINAFATGPSRNRSLVAVSSGLLQQMTPQQVRGVLAHEVAHIANGDMVTMTLLQGVVNAFVMFLARVIALAVSQLFRNQDESTPASGGLAYFGIQMVLELIFMVFGSMLVASFSRWREYRADAGGARLGGRANMIAALEGLKRNLQLPETDSPAAVATLKIEGGKGQGIMRFFASHPSLDDRIARLRAEA